jgi:HD-like signal output (HDOD) protein
VKQPATSIDVLVAKTRNLPLLPGGIAKLLGLNPSDPDFLDAACSLIRGDQALTAQILRLANSVQFGGQSAVTTVERAFMRVGSRMISAMLTEGQVLKIFNTRDPAVVRLWFVSALSGNLAHVIAERHPIKDLAPETAYTYGFLHDIGYLVYVALYPDGGSELVRECLWGPARLPLEREQAILGAPHTVIGRIAAAHWGFPPDLETIIGAHHADDVRERGTADPKLNSALDLMTLVDAVVFAWVRKDCGPEAGDFDVGAVVSRPFHRSICKSIGVTASDLDQALRIAAKIVEETRLLLGLPAFPPLPRA